jgi:signal peptidase II
MLIFRKWGWWLTIVFLVIFLDQSSKNWIVHHFAWGHSEYITSFFNLVRVHNPGAAFSFLAQGSGWQRWFFIALASVMCVFLLWLIHRHPENKL